jgi:hypothetical protein
MALSSYPRSPDVMAGSLRVLRDKVFDFPFLSELQHLWAELPSGWTGAGGELNVDGCLASGGMGAGLKGMTSGRGHPK